MKSGYESVVERALMGLTELKHTSSESQNAVWPFDGELRDGSVAKMVDSGCYPALLNDIQLLEGSQSYQPDGQWLMAVDMQGTLYGKNWRASLEEAQQESGVLLQHAKLRELELQQPELERQQVQVQNELSETNEALAQSEHVQQQNKEHIHQLAQDMASSQTRIDMLNVQVEQWQEQKRVLKEQQQQTLAQEELQAQKQQACQQALMQCDEHLAQLEQESVRFAQQFTEAKQAQQLASSAKQKAQQHLHDAKLIQQQANSDWQLSQSKAEHLQQSLEQGQIRLQELLEEQMMLQEPLAEADEKIAQLLATHEEQQKMLEGLQQQLTEAKTKLQEKQASLKNAQSEVQALNEQLQQLKLDEQGLMIKAQAALEPLQELQQNLKSVLQQLSDDAQQGTHQAQLNKVSQGLSELGAVNLAAIDEFEQAKHRKEYLDTQLADLTAALDTLEGAIKKIDRETKTRFKATFDQVNEDLAELFPKVFGGGSAYLELTSDDLLESGVSIMARPPGKKNSTIHLLSGGEKALTALSLVFSIFRLNPAPFCMLDEVDAPLDDANVGRFCRLVEEMSQTVQFIYISHNKIAMEMAGRLTGVTMAEPGVSRMVAVDIEQAVQMAQA